MTVPSSIAKFEISAQYAERPRLSLAHAYGCCSMRTIPDRSSLGGLVARTPRFHGAPAKRTWNALGAVKINAEPVLVYMHDTNRRIWFSDDYRSIPTAVRRSTMLRDPRRRLLKDAAMERASIDATIATGSAHVSSDQESSGAWIYLTGWMTKDQTVQSATTSTTRTSSLERPPKKQHSSIRRPIIRDAHLAQ